MNPDWRYTSPLQKNSRLVTIRKSCETPFATFVATAVS
jgi:hypothetical protein